MTANERRRLARRSQRKGKEGEREVARFLFKAHYGDEPPSDRTVFIRTKLGTAQPFGDLIVPDDFPFAVSVKNFAISLVGADMQRVWKEACQFAVAAQKAPLLAFRWHSNRQWMVRFQLPKECPIERLRGFSLLLSYWDEATLQPESFVCSLQEWCQWWNAMRIAAT